MTRSIYATRIACCLLALLPAPSWAAENETNNPSAEPPQSAEPQSPSEQPSRAEQQPAAIQEAARIGVAMGAAQRCGFSAEDVDAMTKLGFARLQLLAKDQELYSRAAAVMLQSQSYGSTELQQPQGGCSVVLPTAAGILGNLTYLVARAELEVPDLRRESPLQNFAAWSAELAVMASHCGVRDELVNKATSLAQQYIAANGKDERDRSMAEAELSEMMLRAQLENWGDQTKCAEILTRFGTFYGNLDARLRK